MQILTHPADGETVYWGWTMPRFWEINEAELYLTSPAKERVLLARYSDRPASLIAGSAPTEPKEGIEAELVRVPNGCAEQSSLVPACVFQSKIDPFRGIISIQN